MNTNRIILCMLLTMSLTAAKAQETYQMVIEKNNGSITTFDVRDIKRTYFQISGGSTSTGVFQDVQRVFGNNHLRKSTYAKTASSTSYNDDYEFEITYNSDGNVEKVQILDDNEWNATQMLEYSDGQILVTAYEGDNPYAQMFVTIGENGFASKVTATADGKTYTTDYTYDSDGHLIRFADTYNGETTTQILTWFEGDLVSVSSTSPNGETSSSQIYYKSETQEPIANTSSMLPLNSDITGVDGDHIDPTFFIGVLGFATKHLPIARTSTETYSSGSTYTQSSKFTWTLDDNNRPIKMINNGEQKYNGSDDITWTSTYTFDW